MVLRFGEFVLDIDARLLRRGERPIHLRAKTFELLLLLVAERPKALAKADLMERLWPGTYVQEANLSNSIAELRKALGQRDARAPFIRTVHTFGYAFAADAVPHGSTPPSSPRLLWGTAIIALADGERIVGRDHGADVVLPETTVSRRHARLMVGGGGTHVEDLGSQNGTWINERRIHGRTPLADGDRVRFGGALVVYRSAPSALTTERLPEAGA